MMGVPETFYGDETLFQCERLYAFLLLQAFYRNTQSCTCALVAEVEVIVHEVFRTHVHMIVTLTPIMWAEGRVVSIEYSGI